MNRVIKAKSKDVFDIMDYLFDNGKTLWIVISGMSMYPFLRESLDMVELKRAEISDIKKGDIVLIKRLTDEFVLHRVVRKNKSEFYIMGDAQQWLEGPISGKQLKAVVININRNNKVISCDSFLLKALVRLWFIVRPIRYKLIRVIRFFEGFNIKKIKDRK